VPGLRAATDPGQGRGLTLATVQPWTLEALDLLAWTWIPGASKVAATRGPKIGRRCIAYGRRPCYSDLQ
jgi:hypothetical protein